MAAWIVLLRLKRTTFKHEVVSWLYKTALSVLASRSQLTVTKILAFPQLTSQWT